MKKPLLLAALIGIAAGWSGREIVTWTWRGHSILKIDHGAESLELGLRSDGVVIWREIERRTNSPAEREEPAWYISGATNFMIHNWTNLVITNLILNP